MIGITETDEPEVTLEFVQRDAKWRLIICQDILVDNLTHQPNIWQRFWYRFLLGWRWELIEDSA